MPIIKNKIDSTEDELDRLLKEIVSFDPKKWKERILPFLMEFLKSKPSDATLLKKFNQIFYQIYLKIISQHYFDDAQIQLVIDYLTLLKIMMQSNYRYLLDRPEISIRALDLQNIAKIIKPNTNKILDIFYETLKSSLDHETWLKDYPILSKTILSLAAGIEKNSSNTESTVVLFAAKSFETLGYLERLLKHYRRHTADAIATIKETRGNLYNLFKPFIDKDLLKFIFYKEFLQQSYADTSSSVDFISVCASEEYKEQCKSDYQRFKKKYTCSPYVAGGSFNITIEHNNLAKAELTRACRGMRNVENSFIVWIKKLGLKPIHAESRYTFRVSKSRPEYFIDAFLFEKHQPGPLVAGFYFPKEVKQHCLEGIAYSYDSDLWVSVHEYMHQLYAVTMGRLAAYRDKTFSEGMAELFAGGVCHPRHVSGLKTYADDTKILKTLRDGGFPGYFFAFKWAAYFVNRQPALHKKMLTLLEDKNKFYAEINLFLNNPINTKDFFDWTQLQAKICEDYIHQYPDFPENPTVNLTMITDILERLVRVTRTSSTSNRSLVSHTTVSSTRISQFKTPDELARDLVWAIFYDNSKEIDFLLKKGANPNYSDPSTGNTPLHFLFYYGKCNPKMTQLLLEFGANPNRANHQGVTPSMMALEKCPYAVLEAIRSLLDRFTHKFRNSMSTLFTTETSATTQSLGATTNGNSSHHHNTTPSFTTENSIGSHKTEVAIYKGKASIIIEIPIFLSVSAFFNGIVSTLFNKITQANKDKYPCLPKLIHYGIKPIFIAALDAGINMGVVGQARSIGLENEWSSFAFYLVLNYSSLLIAQPINKKLAEKIHNKYIAFSVQAFMWMFLWNPGLFASEAFIFHIIPMIFIQLVNGLFYGLGERGSNAIIDYIKSRFDREESPAIELNDQTTLSLGSNTFFRFSKPEPDNKSICTEVTVVNSVERAPLILPSSSTSSDFDMESSVSDFGYEAKLNGSPGNATCSNNLVIYSVLNLNIEKLIVLLKERLQFLRRLKGYNRVFGDSLKDLKWEMKTRNSERCIAILAEISNKLDAKYVKECQKKRNEIHSARIIIDSLAQRFRLLDLPLSRIANADKTHYLSAQLLEGLEKMVDSVQYSSVFMRSRLEEKAFSIKDKCVISGLFIALANLEQCLYDANFIAHIHGYYQQYGLIQIRGALVVHQGSSVEALPSSKDNVEEVKAYLRADLLATLGFTLNTGQLLVAEILKLNDKELRTVLQAAMDSIKTFISNMKSQVEAYINHERGFLEGKRENKEPPTQIQGLLLNQGGGTRHTLASFPTFFSSSSQTGIMSSIIRKPCATTPSHEMFISPS